MSKTINWLHMKPICNQLIVLDIIFVLFKKIRAAKGGPLNRGGPCHGIIGILVNPALGRQLKHLIICLLLHCFIGLYIFTLYMMFRLNVQDDNDDF